VLVSLQFLLEKKRGMGYREKKRGMGHQEKNIWTHEGPSIEKKKEKMWAHEGP
jgi:hypothetical protein